LYNSENIPTFAGKKEEISLKKSINAFSIE
jgi:hypothetical protein